MMMKKGFKAQASSTRAASSFGGFGAFSTATSPLSYLAEPPDLSQVTDPHIVVAFKNLGKKDSTTKAKALEELLGILKDSSDLAVLTAWSDLYPRTSIDNSQIVRRSAHQLQGILTANAGKTVVSLLPKLIPSWLAGIHDNDKSVAKTASDALERTFATPEKRSKLWSIYKDSIYERVEDSLTVQTANTLSDERTTSPDEAENKYVRVAGTAMRLLEQLILAKLDNLEILQNKRLWQFVYHNDAYLRNASCNLLLAVLTNHAQGLDWKVLSECLIFQGLKQSQMSSIRAFLSALVELTRVRLAVWTSDYTSKTAAPKRLLQFLRSGSQNGPQQTWELLYTLLRILPAESWRTDSKDVDRLLEAYRTGVSLERVHVDAAWSSYVTLCSSVFEDLGEEEKATMSETHLLPIVLAYMSKSSDATWKVGGRAEKTAVSALLTIAQISIPTLRKTWASLADMTIEKMRLSLPESSKDFQTSQDGVLTHGKRLLALEDLACASAPEVLQSTLRSAFGPSDTSVLHAAIDLLRSRNGKPYGAAGILEGLVDRGLTSDGQLMSLLQSDLENLLESPSCPHMVAIAFFVRKPIVSRLLSISPQSPYTTRGIIYFLQHASEQDVGDLSVQTTVLKLIGNFSTDTERRYAMTILQNSKLSETTLRSQILGQLVQNLEIPEKQPDNLETLDLILSQKGAADALGQNEVVATISSKLLLLADSNPSLADRATALNGRLTATSKGSVGALTIIKQQLQGEGAPLSILTVTDLGLKSLADAKLDDLLPSAEDWQRALRPHFKIETNFNLAITSPLQGSVWTIAQPSKAALPSDIRDSEDFSLLFRLTFYTTKLAVSNGALNEVVGHQMEALFTYYPLALQLINEKLTLDEANSVWLGSTDEVLQAASDILSEGAQILRTLQGSEAFIKSWVARGLSLGGHDRENYLTALAFLSVMGNIIDQAPKTILQDFETEILASHKSDNLIQSATLLCAAGESLTISVTGLKLVNEFVASITASPSQIDRIVLLNILLSSSPDTLEKVPQQRLVFLFKKLVAQIEDGAALGLLSETLKLISKVIPHVQDVYGEHWEQIVQGLIGVWSNFSREDVASIHSSLLVYVSLRKALRSEEVNEDLQEAVSQNKSGLDAGILFCLQNLNVTLESIDSPRTITAELLRRQLDSIKIPETMDSYKLLASSQRPIRRAAYDLLHRTVPEKQEQLSYDLILENKTAHLPSELLQLVSDAEDMDRYLLGWLVVFDHFPKASYKLREVYTTDIRDSNHLIRLLEVICEKVRISSNRTVDASGFGITNFDIDSTESTDQQLTIHIYFLSLLYLPSLVKTWHLEQKNRIKMPLEAWTQKYMSPHIIAAALDTVTTWSSQQQPSGSSSTTDESDRQLEIRTFPRSGEIIASIPVDPESPAISLAITLPAAYPLESPAVISRSRVGVSEKNWSSWLRTFQIIIFSTGSIIEGLVAFKRNVSLALTGHSECAICYSIIGQDMQTPNKKCGTCKNMFHGVCLFRWFRSSNSSSCPLCRNNFNYA